MVRLIEKSNIDPDLFPFTYKWDEAVRENFEDIQKCIDAQTYQLQRSQRYLFSLKYPKGHNSDLITLNLLKKKQMVGAVTKEQLDMYKSINPSIDKHYNRVFATSTLPMNIGFGVGLGMLAFASFFNLTWPTRVVYFAIPVAFDATRTMRTVRAEKKSLQFLDWVIEYRKSCSFNERYKDIFDNESRLILGDNILLSLGEQLTKLISG